MTRLGFNQRRFPSAVMVDSGAENKRERMTDLTRLKGRVKQAKRASVLGSCRHQNGKAQRTGHDTAA